AGRILGLDVAPLDAVHAERVLAEGARGGEEPWAVVERLAARVGLALVRATGSDTESPDTPRLVRSDAGWALVSGTGACTLEHAYVLLLAPASGPIEAPSSHHAWSHHVSPWDRVVALVRLERREVGAMVVYAGLGAVLGLAVPVAVQALVNTLLFGTLVAPVLWLALLVAVVLFGAAALQLTQLWTVELLQRRIFVNLVAELAWRLPHGRLEALDGEHRFRLGNRFLDVVIVQKAVAKLLTDGIGGVVAVVAGTVLLGVYHPYLLGYALTLWLAAALIVGVRAKRATDTAIAESYAKHAVAGWFEEMIAHPHAVRGAGGAAWARARADALSQTYLDARTAHFRAWFIQVAGLLGLYALASAALLSLGGFLVVAGQLTVGQLMAAELVMTVVLGSLAKLGKQLEQVYDLGASLDKIGFLLEIPVRDVPREVRALPTGPLPVAAENLSYVYDDGRVAFSGLSFEVPAGALVAVTGPVGSGRRTLLEVLAGLRAPTSGVVRFGGVPLPRGLPADLSKAAALVRGVAVVEGTLLENIHLGRPEVSDAQVDAALAEAGLDDVTQRVPADHVLAPDGRPLGEAQTIRLGLARALAGAPRVLLVDARHAALLPRVPSLRSEARVTFVLVDDHDAMSRCTHRLDLGAETPALEVLS
ncbi:MAG: hypothetical protein RLZZ299_2105, partial [Pseudomonadota bacterium]